MLNLTATRTLREVAARGSFSAAAAALHFTQPAVSRQIALLERSVGLPLVLRSRQGVRLTQAGRLLLDHADAIHARLQLLERELGELASGARVDVVVGGFPTAFVGLVPGIVTALRERVPDAHVALRRCGHDEALQLVRSGDLDLALVFARMDAQPPQGDVEVVPLADEPLLALLPAIHRLARRKRVDLADLRDERWLIGAPDAASSLIVTACHAAGFEPDVAFETDDALAQQSLVAAGMGVTLTTPWLATALRDDVVLRPLAPPGVTRKVSAIVAAPAGPGAKLLLELAREVATTRGAA